MIAKKEKTLSNGSEMLLRLLPRDPRSLMQGDYMALRYDIGERVPVSQAASQGCIVASLDENHIAKFVRIYKGESLGPNEHLLFYRKRKGLRFGAESFFFQEGDAKLYAEAKYAELRVDESGRSVLVGLRGEDLRLLGKPAIE
jgi:uncharacterized membrane-anchored protein